MSCFILCTESVLHSGYYMILQYPFPLIIILFHVFVKHMAFLLRCKDDATVILLRGLPCSSAGVATAFPLSARINREIICLYNVCEILVLISIFSDLTLFFFTNNSWSMYILLYSLMLHILFLQLFIIKVNSLLDYLHHRMAIEKKECPSISS